MSNGKHSAVLELILNQSLNFLLSGQIDVGCGFIQDDNLVLPQNSPADAEERLLTG